MGSCNPGHPRDSHIGAISRYSTVQCTGALQVHGAHLTQFEQN